VTVVIMEAADVQEAVSQVEVEVATAERAKVAEAKAQAKLVAERVVEAVRVEAELAVGA
jgi:hypothetical protein